jgi:hypothetical protein
MLLTMDASPTPAAADIIYVYAIKSALVKHHSLLRTDNGK